MPNRDGTDTKEERHNSALNRSTNWYGVALCIVGVWIWPLLVIGLVLVIFVPVYDDAAHDHLQTTEPGSRWGLISIPGYLLIIVIIFALGALAASIY